MTVVDRPTWRTTSHLLAGYSGSASELFVIDIPGEEFPRVLQVVSQLPEVQVHVLSGEPVEPPAPLDEALLDRMGRHTAQESEHNILGSAYGTNEHLQIYISTPVGVGTFDVEFVFWNDLSFPADLDAAERSRRLERLVALAEACRSSSSTSRCIPSDEHNGDPRELLENEYAVIW
ncbi:MAG: hypothetical protein JNK45_30370 [Myxococcales bacterium]|jgi:hypothetical protein|nr:hypothetical protein [Myxococcales bacterium]